MRKMTTSGATSTATSKVPFVSQPEFGEDLLLMFVEDVGLDIFTPKVGEPLVPRGVFRDVVAMVTGSPLVSLEVFRELVSMMTGGPLVTLEAFRELIAVVIGGPLVPSEVSRELVAVVTGGPLVPLEVSRGLVAMVSPVVVWNPADFTTGTAGILVALEISRGIDNVWAESFWEIIDSFTGGPLLAAMEVPGEETSLAV